MYTILYTTRICLSTLLRASENERTRLYFTGKSIFPVSYKIFDNCTYMGKFQQKFCLTSLRQILKLYFLRPACAPGIPASRFIIPAAEPDAEGKHILALCLRCGVCAATALDGFRRAAWLGWRLAGLLPTFAYLFTKNSLFYHRSGQQIVFSGGGRPAYAPFHPSIFQLPAFQRIRRTERGSRGVYRLRLPRQRVSRSSVSSGRF